MGHLSNIEKGVTQNSKWTVKLFRERVLSCFDINWYYVVVPHILKVTSKTGLDTGRREAGWRHLGNTSFWPLPCFPATLVPAFLLTGLRVSAELAASYFSVPTVPVPLVVVFIKLKWKVVLSIWQELEEKRHTFQKEKFGIWDNLGNIWIAPAVTTVPVASIIPWRQVSNNILQCSFDLIPIIS